MDTTKKGRMIHCKTCHRKTRHIAEPEKDEKLVWWKCEECGSWELYDHWT